MKKYKIGDKIKMDRLQFDCTELRINEFEITGETDKVFFIKQDYFNNAGKLVSSFHSGIHKSTL